MTTEPRASLVEVDLLPCPFCGGSSLVDWQPCWNGGFGIRCRTCHTTMDSRCSTKAEAAAAWNTRHRLEALRTQGDGEWVLVPREPTEAMIWAYEDCPYDGAEDMWREMLSAAPTQTSSREEGQ